MCTCGCVSVLNDALVTIPKINPRSITQQGQHSVVIAPAERIKLAVTNDRIY